MAIVTAAIVGVFEAGKPGSVDLVLPLRVLECLSHQVDDGHDDQFGRDRQDQPGPKQLLPQR